MDWNELPCHFAEPAKDLGLRRCFHPQLTGLMLVAPPACAGCYYRTPHPPAEALPASELRGWDCAHFEATSADLADPNAAHACRHPAHGRTTRLACAACPDYVFPYLSPRMPVEMAAELLRLGIRDQADQWWTWPNVQAAFRRLMEDAIDGLSAGPRGEAGRGIVIVGGGKYFPSAYVTLRVLRHVGCALPVQLWHLNGELTDRDRALVAAWGGECVNGQEHAEAGDFPWHETWWKGWQLKAFALAHSPFQEVLYLDADCYPTRDPEFLFQERGYRERGAIFWPDLEDSSCLLPADLPAVFGAPPLPGLPCESGQLLIHKELCWRELQLALFLNAQADYTYRLLWGDKDTFPIAWRRLGRDYARLWPVAGATPQAVLQYDGQGQVLFQHRATDKFRLPDTQFETNHQRHPGNQRNPALAHEDFCFAVLDELAAARQ